MTEAYQRHRILIWGKTTPVLSNKHIETVCTGGVLESGEYVRLYPIPYRLLSDDKQFKKYQWIEAEIRRSAKDTRPESREVRAGSIVCLDEYYAMPKGLSQRCHYMMKDDRYALGSVEELIARQRVTGQSLGHVAVRKVIEVCCKAEKDDAIDKMRKKLEGIREMRKQGALEFDDTIREEAKYNLEFVNAKLKIYGHSLMVKWMCNGPECRSHDMKMLDWEATAAMQRMGPEAAAEHVHKVLDIAGKHLRFFLGNLKGHPSSFVIGGTWRWRITGQKVIDFD